MTAVKQKKEKRIRRGFWLEEINGVVYYCHKYREDGKPKVLKRSLAELTTLLTLEFSPLQSFTETEKFLKTSNL